MQKELGANCKTAVYKGCSYSIAKLYKSLVIATNGGVCGLTDGEKIPLPSLFEDVYHIIEMLKKHVLCRMHRKASNWCGLQKLRALSESFKIPPREPWSNGVFL
jgi:hypothetical protein